MTIKYRFLTDITSDDQIITANRRLATHLHAAFNLAQQEKNLAWVSPSILPLSQWLSSYWSQSNNTALLLDSMASRLIWQSILRKDSTDFPLLDYTRAAEQAQQAWELLQQWCLPLATLENTQSDDIKAFLRWARQFQQLCEEKNWTDAALLPVKIQSLLARSDFVPPHRLYTVGFDSFPPSIKALLDTIAQRAERITPTDLPPTNMCQCLELANAEAEFRVMAQWARARWKKNPSKTIGCIVPELLSERSLVERIFKETFQDAFDQAINIAGGHSLLDFPIIQTALSVLDLLSNRPLERHQLTLLLLSPYLQSGISEKLDRASLDRYLRRSHEPLFTLTSLLAQTSALLLAPLLSKRLRNAETALQLSVDSPAYPSEWAEIFVARLEYLGWPGERPMDSQEFQLVSQFQQQFRHYAGLDWLLGQQTHHEALETLRQLIGEALFQTESHQSATIQVLGILEASGLHFDELWVTNMNDDIWPRMPSPNPFIPVQLQREYGMPRSSANHERDYAQQIMARLRHSTTRLVASYSLQKQDEQRELSPSPLLRDFEAVTLCDLGLSEPQAPKAKPQLEKWQDDQAPPLQPDEVVRGGASILQRQAECPFRAFAEIRLQAKPFEELDWGLSPAERGTLVHAVLAEVWRRLGNSATLKNLAPESLSLLVESAVSDSLNEEKFSQNKENLSLLTLEKQRLHQLVLQWLALEQEREPFSVTAIEQPCQLTMQGLTLYLQVDRIDTLSDGSQLIIDYKTGSPSPSSWFGDRPDEPQLPLYALQNPEQVRGLAFGQVRAQNIKFNGLTAEAGQLPGVKTIDMNWGVLIEQWQTTLNQLTEDFCLGKAAVDPKKFPTTCTYCHLASVCRIGEMNDH